MSAKATMTEYFFRRGNVLTQMSITEDPVFLDEPLVKTTNLQLNANATANQYQAWLFCQADDEVPGRDPAYVPHLPAGQEPLSHRVRRRNTSCRSRPRAAAPRPPIPSTPRR